MALRGVRPKAITKRLKALFYGPAGVGKTTAAIQFPHPYLIDCERGAENEQYVKLLNAAHGAYFGTVSFEDMLKEVTALLSEKHTYKTLIIDPLTVPYNQLVDEAARALADPSKGSDGTEFGRHKAKADRQLKHLLNLLLRLDMNVIITSHAKTLWKRGPGDGIVDGGQTFDCYAKLDYLFDLVFEIQKRGNERVGIVRKTRHEGFPEGEVFPFAYPEIARRYGAAILEAQAQPQVLASEEQIARIEKMAEAQALPEATLHKLLAKADADTLAELPQDKAAEIVAWLEKRARGEGEDKPKSKRAAKTEETESQEVTA